MRLAIYGGAVILPLAGIIGAWMFYAREERAAASTTLGCAFVGILLWLIVLTALR